MVRERDSISPLEISNSTVTSDGIFRVIQKHYDINQINEGYLLQSGYNDTYIFECVDKSRWIARLSGNRPRGSANIEYEVSMLEHLSANGVPVAGPVRPRTGAAGVEVELAEGLRTLAVFHFINGDDPETLEDWELTGSGLAKIHNASEDYSGPASRYTLDIDHLLRSPMKLLLQVPRLDQGISELLNKLATDIESDFKAAGDLSRIGCHGDCHGGNNFIQSNSSNEREAVFFDFDDSGPGYLAYDLSVFLWNQLGGRKSLSEKASDNWNRFLKGYEQERELAFADRKAIPIFVRMRHLLWLSERAGRRDQWGIGALRSSHLSEDAEMLDHLRSTLSS